MYPEHWQLTLPHLVTIYRGTTKQQPLLIRAAALSAMSFVAPVGPASDKDEQAKEELDRVIQLMTLLLPRGARTGAKLSLKDLAAIKLASLDVRDAVQLPEELSSMMASLGWSSGQPPAFNALQLCAAKCLSRLQLRDKLHREDTGRTRRGKRRPFSAERVRVLTNSSPIRLQ
jgi:hypothetical protein